MSKYMTKQEFEKWAEHYYREFIMRNDFWAYSFGAKDKKQRGIIIINKINGKVARSYCHPNDEWDYATGLAVAYARYMGIETPRVENRYFIEDLVGKEVTLPSTYTKCPATVFVTPYKKEGFVLVVDSCMGYTMKVHPLTYIQEHDIKK